MKIRTNRNPVAQETFRAIGIEDIHICEIEDLKEHIEAGNCEGGEGIYSRIYPLEQDKVTKSVLNTEHSLFLTTMIMRDDFWQSLSPEVKAVIKDAAIKAGRRERETTIADGQEAKQRLIADGIEVHELTPEERKEFETKTQTVYEKFEPTFSPGLIDKIKKS
jgi:TRAP-type C4-dicarboxylate transport system substrate-binding protein